MPSPVYGLNTGSRMARLKTKPAIFLLLPRCGFQIDPIAWSVLDVVSLYGGLSSAQRTGPCSRCPVGSQAPAAAYVNPILGVIPVRAAFATTQGCELLCGVRHSWDAEASSMSLCRDTASVSERRPEAPSVIPAQRSVSPHRKVRLRSTMA